MSYYRFINNGNGPTKLFVGGIHGKEGETTLKFFKSLSSSDFSNGKTIIYNFDETPYISTLKKEYYESDMGIEIINIIKKYKPDFYTELHCYNIHNYEKLISLKRWESQGVPPLIELENKVLISSVSPLIRKKYFKSETICKTLEIPCLNEFNPEKKLINEINQDSNQEFVQEFVQEFNQELAIETYLNVVKLIAKSTNRRDFERNMIAIYPKQVKLAIKYAGEIFGKNYPPF